MKLQLAVLTLALLATACAKPEKQLESGRRYLSITYNDTTLESFDRTDRAVTVLLVERSGDSVRFRLRTADQALVPVVEFTLHPATERGERPTTRRIGMPERTLPLIGISVACLEQVLRRARVLGGDSVSVPVMLVGPHASLEVLTMIRNGPDSVILVAAEGNSSAALHLALDSLGRVAGGVIPISGAKIIRLD